MPTLSILYFTCAMDRIMAGCPSFCAIKIYPVLKNHNDYVPGFLDERLGAFSFI